MDATRSGYWRGNRCPRLPSSGDRNGRAAHERARDAVQVKFQRPATSGAGSPQVDAADSGTEVDVFKLSPVAIVGEGEVIAAACVRSGFRLQAKFVVIT